MKLDDLIAKRAFSTPKKTFCYIDGKKYSYLNFNQHVQKMQAAIKGLSLDCNRVVLDFDEKINLLVGLVACNREKKIPVMLPLRQDRIKDIDYKLIAGKAAELNISCILQQKNEAPYQEYVYCLDDVQCILFTSGTNGLPSPVELTFGNNYYSSKSWNNLLNFSKNDNYLNVLPVSHIAGLSIFSIIPNCNLDKIIIAAVLPAETKPELGKFFVISKPLKILLSFLFLKITLALSSFLTSSLVLTILKFNILISLFFIESSINS